MDELLEYLTQAGHLAYSKKRTSSLSPNSIVFSTVGYVFDLALPQIPIISRAEGDL